MQPYGQPAYGQQPQQGYPPQQGMPQQGYPAQPGMGYPAQPMMQSAPGDRLFHHLDGKGSIKDNCLSWTEFAPLCQQIGWDANVAQQLWWQTDTDRSGTLDKREFLQFAARPDVFPYLSKLENQICGAPPAMGGYGQPMMGQPMMGQPMMGQPMMGQPMMGQPMMGQQVHVQGKAHGHMGGGHTTVVMGGGKHGKSGHGHKGHKGFKGGKFKGMKFKGITKGFKKGFKKFKW